MSETDNNSHDQRPRMSKLAIAAMICFVTFGGCLLFYLAEIPKNNTLFILVALVGSFASLVAAPTLGIAALIKIKLSEGRLTGKGFAITGISVLGFWIALWFILPRMGKLSPRLLCQTNLSGLGKAMAIYANNNEGEYPSTDKWCDLLIKHTKVPPNQFICHSSDAIVGESSYAINRNMADQKMSDIPGDMVMLFETDFGKDSAGRQEPLGNRSWHQYLTQRYPFRAKHYPRSQKVYKLRWNQSGGPEILTTEYHIGKGCNVVFNDGSVRFVRTDELSELKWRVEEAEK